MGPEYVIIPRETQGGGIGLLEFDSQFALYDVTPVANCFIRDYLPGTDGEKVKVYLYGLMCCMHPQPDLTLAGIAAALQMEEREVLDAFRHWEFMGLVQRVSDNPLLFRYVHPIWRSLPEGAVEIDRASQAFMEDLYAAFGGQRDLTGAEKRKAWEWVEEDGFPTEVVLVLVKHLVATRGLNFPFGGKEALRLVALLRAEQVKTVEGALEVLGREQEIEEGAAAVLRRFRQRRHLPSQDEIDLYRKWRRDWGFSRDDILAACAETTKGAPNFGYLDGVLKGIHERGGAVGQDREENDLVREMLHALGAKNVSINDGTRAIYRQMTELYPHEVVLLAARECSAKGRGVDDVLDGLERWKKRGLQDIGEIRRFIDEYNAQSALLKKLAEIWGKPVPTSQANRAFLEKWQRELGMDEALILHCAAFAQGAEKNMPYLDRLLVSFAGQGVRTAEAADEANAAWKRKQGGGGKTVSAQQYEQRDYSGETEDLPDWVMKRWKEMQQNGQ